MGKEGPNSPEWDTSDMSDSRAVVAVVGAAALFGTVGTALAKAPAGFDPLGAGVLRLLVGGLGLVLLAHRSLGALRAAPRVLVVGAVSVATYQLGFFSATRSTGVAVATLVTIGVSPIASRFIGAVRRRPAPRRAWYLAAIVVIVGLVLLVALGSSNLVIEASGVAAAVLAGVAYAAYTECASILIDDEVPPTTALAGMFFLAGLLTAPLLAWRGIDLVQSGRGVVVLGYLGVVTLTVAYVAFGWGLRHLPPTTVVMLTMVEPVVAAALASLVLSERLSVTGWVGAGLVVVAMPIVAWSSSDTVTT